MTNLEEKLIQEIKDFIEKARLTTELFKNQFGIKGTPLQNVKRFANHDKSIPFQGELKHGDDIIRYKFHGNGCRFIFPQNKIVDFDYILPDWEYDFRFGFFNLWEFVHVTLEEFTDKFLFEEYLKKLEEKGKIIPIPQPDDLKKKISLNTSKSVEELEAEGFFEKFESPKYKSYKLRH